MSHGGIEGKSVSAVGDPLPNMGLSSTENGPRVRAQSSAIYTVTFQGNWTTASTPGGVVGEAHFTTLIGAIHNDMATFWESGGTATPGVENVAELGSTGTFESEINANSNATSIIEKSVSSGGTGSATFDITLTSEHPLVTLLSMIGPSPDWFVGVSGLSLLNTQGQWMSMREVDLFPYDAGTEEGTEFSLLNPATSPQGVITTIKGMGKFSNVRMARLTFTRQSFNTAPSFTSDSSLEVDENRTAAGTVVAEDPDSGDGVGYAITGAADASQFQIGEATGVLTFTTPPNYERPADVASTDPVNAAANNQYIVTVTATGGTADRAITAEQTITVTVGNLEEGGWVSFSKVGAEIRAELSDPDGGVSRRNWQWARSSNRRTGWVNIGGATSDRYSSSGDDGEMYLRATVSYSDGQGSDKQARGVSTYEITPPKLLVSVLFAGLNIPWDLAFTPDGAMLFTQRAGGLIARLANGAFRTVDADFGDLESASEGGLMGIVVDPEFASNRRFYTCQNHTGREVQVIAWNINAAYSVATRAADPLVGGIPATSGLHGGCRLRFGPEGYLWIATGDAASGTVPQDLTSLGGKVLRVDPSTGAGASTNPFASSPRIYTYGHRNPQGLALRPGTSQMWSVEHGPDFDDEINLLLAGRNYGWDPVPGYDESVSMTDLVKFPGSIEAKWSSGSPTLATSGGIFLEGAQWGIWEGRMAVATLKDSKLRLFEFTPNGDFVSQVVVPELDGRYGRLRTPMMGPDGALYVTTSNGGGKDRILRIIKDDAVPVTLKLTPDSIGENGGVSTVTASQRRASNAVTTVVVSAEAVAPAVTGDFTLSVNRTLTISPGRMSSVGVVTVRAVDNHKDFPNKTVSVSATAENINGVTPPPAVTLRIVDDDASPVIKTISPILVPENQKAVVTLAATDADRPAEDLAWAITGGADRDKFILTADGELTFAGAMDYENPDDANGDGDYQVTVQVSDGANPVEAALTVRLLDVDDNLPMLSSAAVDGATLTLTYGEPLDGSSRPASGDFTVQVDGSGRTVAGVLVSGSTVTLTLDPAVEHGETGIRVSYTPGMKPIRDVAGSQALGLSREPVRNDTPDTTPPEVRSLGITSDPGKDQTYAAGDEIEVTVTFSETVEVEGTPQLGLRVGTRTRTAGYLRGTDTAVLVFGYEVVEGDEARDGVSANTGHIDLNGGKITDKSDNNADLEYRVARTRMGHRVDGVRPEFLGAAVDGAMLTLTYGEPLDRTSTPASGDFTVQVDGSGRTVAGVLVSGSTVTLTLDPAVEHGDTGIRVSYTVPTGVGANPIRDAVGNDARGLNNRSVTNTTGAPNTEPEITTPESFNVAENQLVAKRLAARDTDAGDKVTGWAIVGGADRVQFSIAPDTGELSFRTAPDYENPADVASTDPVSGLEDNEYVVRVEVKSGAGARELEAEQTFIVRVTDQQEPPGVPEAPVISGETVDSLIVSWNEPDNTGPDITDYDVQYRETGMGRFTGVVHDGPGLSTTISDLEPGTDYEVQVRATNDEGTSDWSASDEGGTIALLTLEMMAMEEPPVSGPFAVRFSFSEPVTGFRGTDVDSERDPECMDDQSNTVFCDPGIGRLETADNRIFTITVTPQTDRVAHSYTLTLTVEAGSVSSSVGSKPNEEPEEPLEVRVSPPGAPEMTSSVNLRTSPGSGSVRLSWNRPSDNAGSAIIRYEYRYAATGEGWSEWENVAAGSSGVTVGGLINGREYVFEVRAVNALGKGGVETAMATPLAGRGGGGGGGLLFPPQAPAALAALAGDGMVRLEWSPPASDGGSPILRYEYRLKEGRGEFGEWTSIPDSAPDEVNASGYTVGGLGNGTVYAIELRAVNAAGDGQVSEAVEVVMRLDPAYWSNFRAEDLEGAQLRLEVFLSGGSGDRELRFGEGLRFEEDELDGEGEVTATRMGSYGYRYTSRTTGRLQLDRDRGEACEVRLTFTGEGTGSYIYRCGGSLEGQGSFQLSELVNRVPEITSLGPFEVEENTARVAQLEAVDWDEEDEVTGYGIAGGADGGLFTVEAETGELSFRQAPDYENPGDVESEEPRSGAADNEYMVVVEVRSGEGERERRREQAIRVRVRDLEMEEAGEDEMGEDGTESLFIPVILSSAGRNQSFFTSELTLTNRGEQEVSLDYTYTAKDEPGRRSGTASDVLPAGRQKIETDALEYLRDLGIPIPETGNQLGTLRVEVPLGSEVEAVVRTTTVVPEGRAGLAYLGVGEEEGFEEAVYLCGLRQNSRDRSNVAFQNMGAPEEAAITIRTTVYSGEAADASARVLEEIELEPGEFHQYSGLLGVLGVPAQGYVKVERVEGRAPFYAYGVINDQANSDGSFVFPVTASSLEGVAGQTLPVIVETSAFTSELTVTNFSKEPRTLDFQFVAEGIKTDEKTAGFSMKLEAGQQEIIAEVVEELRRQRVAGLGSTRGFYAGPLFVVAEGGDMSGIVIGARTGSQGGGGQYSVFYNAVPEGGAFTEVAWVEGLQQDQENRSNLALVNTGEVDESPSVFHLEIYDGETGLLAETVVTKPIPARRWHQINGILGSYAPETRQGYIRILKVSGENPFLAYGVVNDGGAPGERSGDGAYLPARE